MGNLKRYSFVSPNAGSSPRHSPEHAPVPALSPPSQQRHVRHGSFETVTSGGVITPEPESALSHLGPVGEESPREEGGPPTKARLTSGGRTWSAFILSVARFV